MRCQLGTGVHVYANVIAKSPRPEAGEAHLASPGYRIHTQYPVLHENKGLVLGVVGPQLPAQGPCRRLLRRPSTVTGASGLSTVLGYKTCHPSYAFAFGFLRTGACLTLCAFVDSVACAGH